MDNEPYTSQIVFELKHGDYLDIADSRDDWLRLDIRDSLFVGLNGPVGMPAKAWLPIVASLFCACAGLVASWTTLANVLAWLLTQLNATGKPVARWPSLPLVLDVLRSSIADMWSSKVEYTRSLVAPLEAAVHASENQINVFAGIDLERDVISRRRSIVLDLSNLHPTWWQHFLISLLLAQLLYGRMYRGHRVDRTEAVIFLDEADELVSQQAEARFGTSLSVVSNLLKRAREYGLQCVIGVSHLSGVSRHVLTNPQYHLLFNLPSAESAAVACRTLMLPANAIEMFPTLRSGQCLYRASQSPWPHAMLAEIDYVSPAR